MIDEWKENDQLSEKLVINCLNTFREIKKSNTSVQNAWRKANQKAFIEQLRKEMSHNRFAYALISDYDMANPPVQPTSPSTGTAMLVVGGVTLLGILAAAVISSGVKKPEAKTANLHPIVPPGKGPATALPISPPETRKSPAAELPTPPPGDRSILPPNSELAQKIQENSPTKDYGTGYMDGLHGLLDLPPLDEELAKTDPERAKMEQEYHHASNICPFAEI